MSRRPTNLPATRGGAEPSRGAERGQHFGVAGAPAGRAVRPAGHAAPGLQAMGAGPVRTRSEPGSRTASRSLHPGALAGAGVYALPFPCGPPGQEVSPRSSSTTTCLGLARPGRGAKGQGQGWVCQSGQAPGRRSGRGGGGGWRRRGGQWPRDTGPRQQTALTSSGPSLLEDFGPTGAERMEEWEWTTGPRALAVLSRGSSGKVGSGDGGCRK